MHCSSCPAVTPCRRNDSEGTVACCHTTHIDAGRRKIEVTVTGTAEVKKSLLGLDSWIAAAEEVSLQTASEGEKRRCRRDVLRQTVPNTGCSDWKGPVADS